MKALPGKKLWAFSPASRLQKGPNERVKIHDQILQPNVLVGTSKPCHISLWIFCMHSLPFIVYIFNKNHRITEIFPVTIFLASSIIRIGFASVAMIVGTRIEFKVNKKKNLSYSMTILIIVQILIAGVWPLKTSPGLWINMNKLLKYVAITTLYKNSIICQLFRKHITIPHYSALFKKEFEISP